MYKKLFGVLFNDGEEIREYCFSVEEAIIMAKASRIMHARLYNNLKKVVEYDRNHNEIGVVWSAGKE